MKNINLAINNDVIKNKGLKSQTNLEQKDLL